VSTYQINNRRQSIRIELDPRVSASCLFNRWLKPVTNVQIVDVSKHGMKIFSRDYLKLSASTVRVNELGESIKGKIVWRNECNDGYMCGFMFNEGEEISDEDIEILCKL